MDLKKNVAAQLLTFILAIVALSHNTIRITIHKLACCSKSRSPTHKMFLNLIPYMKMCIPILHWVTSDLKFIPSAHGHIWHHFLQDIHQVIITTNLVNDRSSSPSFSLTSRVLPERSRGLESRAASPVCHRPVFAACRPFLNCCLLLLRLLRCLLF